MKNILRCLLIAATVWLMAMSALHMARQPAPSCDDVIAFKVVRG